MIKRVEKIIVILNLKLLELEEEPNVLKMKG